jgi:hypothetical protein
MLHIGGWSGTGRKIRGGRAGGVGGVTRQKGEQRMR